MYKLNPQFGARGACYPWQSGSTGQEETSKVTSSQRNFNAPKTHFNPLDNRWYPDNSFLQQHINIAVFYNVWKYVTNTGALESWRDILDDFAFLNLYGAEMMLEIAKFWSSRCSFNEKTGRQDFAFYGSNYLRYEILGVMGPDEFHEIDPCLFIGFFFWFM